MTARILLFASFLALCSCDADEAIDATTDASLLYEMEGEAPYQKYRYLFLPEQAQDVTIDSARMTNNIKSMRVLWAPEGLFDSIGDSAFLLRQEHFFNAFGQTEVLREFEYEELGTESTGSAVTVYKYDVCGKLLEQLIFLEDTITPAAEYYWNHYYTGTAADGSIINFKSESSKLKGGYMKYVLDSGKLQTLAATEKFEGRISMNQAATGDDETFIDDVDWSVAIDYSKQEEPQELHPRMLEVQANNQIFKYYPSGILLSHISGVKEITDGTDSTTVVAHLVSAKRGKEEASIEYTYDDAGRIIGQTFVSDASPSELMHPNAEFEFDDQGLVTAIRAFSPFSSVIIKLEYEFF